MREDLSTIITAIPLPTVIIGVDERIVNANDAAVEIFGGNLVGRHHVTAFRHPQLLDSIEECFRTQSPSKAQFTLSNASRDQTIRAMVRSLILSDFSGLMICFEDVTSIHQAGQIRRDFVANVSHELRTPLTAMLGFIETLRGPAKNDPVAQERFMGTLESETRRMIRLVQDLLALSRVEGEERVRPGEETDIAFILASTVERLQPLANSRENSINLVSPYEQFLLNGNPDQLGQIFTNLIENAIKYGKQGGTVDVTVTRIDYEPGLRSAALRIDIRDEGPGIDPLHIPRLTERFYRIDTHRSRELGGTGLGLAIVKHIVNRHRGRLRISSSPGQGSCFSVILPLS